MLVAACHFAVGILRGYHARVFISYQHDFESAATELYDAMRQASINPILLPFLKEPDHDELLAQIKRTIREAHVVVCLPDRHSSFVENEVSMAFALNKPLLFVLGEGQYYRLPNT